jgi:hypothetical protein
VLYAPLTLITLLHPINGFLNTRNCEAPPILRISVFWCPTSLLFKGYSCSLTGMPWPRREVRHSLASSAKVKNELSYTSTPPIHLNGADRDNFTFYYHGPVKKDVLLSSLLLCPYGDTNTNLQVHYSFLSGLVQDDDFERIPSTKRHV